MPLIVVASAQPGLADNVAERLRRAGNLVYTAHSPEGCLRVATSLGVDMILLDPALPERVERLLRAHPISSRASIQHLADATVRAMLFETRSSAANPRPFAA
jgi:CheY-like chemotaxis protein